MSIRRVHGTQAEGALAQHRLVKVDRASAEQLWNAGVAVVFVGNRVGAHAFFGRWHLATTADPREAASGGVHYLDEGTFERYANRVGSYLEPELGSQVAYFVARSALERYERERMTPAQVRKVARKMHLSPRLAVALDGRLEGKPRWGVGLTKREIVTVDAIARRLR